VIGYRLVARNTGGIRDQTEKHSDCIQGLMIDNPLMITVESYGFLYLLECSAKESYNIFFQGSKRNKFTGLLCFGLEQFTQ
jgi:hypothetical protein